MRYEARILRDWIAAIREGGRDLSKWECDFVDSVADQLEEHGRLSERQIVILERIYSEKTP